MLSTLPIHCHKRELGPKQSPKIATMFLKVFACASSPLLRTRWLSKCPAWPPLPLFHAFLPHYFYRLLLLMMYTQIFKINFFKINKQKNLKNSLMFVSCLNEFLLTSHVFRSISQSWKLLRELCFHFTSVFYCSNTCYYMEIPNTYLSFRSLKDLKPSINSY